MLVLEYLVFCCQLVILLVQLFKVGVRALDMLSLVVHHRSKHLQLLLLVLHLIAQLHAFSYRLLELALKILDLFGRFSKQLLIVFELASRFCSQFAIFHVFFLQFLYVLLELTQYAIEDMAYSLQRASLFTHSSQPTQLSLNIAVAFPVASQPEHRKRVEDLMACAVHQW